MLLSGCSSLGSAGPGQRAIIGAQKNDPNIRVIEVDGKVVHSVVSAQGQSTFAKIFGDAQPRHGFIRAGDILDIVIWEAPPAVLFVNGAALPSFIGAPGTTNARGTDIGGQMLDANGDITVPFVGRVRSVGRTPADVASEIRRRLSSKAHDPQVTVRIAENNGTGVTVVGDVVTSRRTPLTTRNERLLDALASAGGVRQSVDKVMIQITRGSIVAARPLGAIIRDPAENITLAESDVVTALFQPFSFQAMGAVGATAEVPFEATGITLAQAVARSGGLKDERANAKGLFIFRFEDPTAIPLEQRMGAPLTPDGKVPVIYRINLTDPASFFLMQSFPMRNGDMLYVSNAPLVDFQRFAGLVSQLIFSVGGVANVVR